MGVLRDLKSATRAMVTRDEARLKQLWAETAETDDVIRKARAAIIASQSSWRLSGNLSAGTHSDLFG